MDIDKINQAVELYENCNTNVTITNLSFKALRVFGDIAIVEGENVLRHLKNIVDFPIRKQIYTTADLKGILYSTIIKPIYNGIDTCGYIIEFIDSVNLIELLGKVDFYDDIQDIFSLLNERINDMLSITSILQESLANKYMFEEEKLTVKQKSSCKNLSLMMSNVSEYFGGFFNPFSEYVIELKEFLQNICTNVNVILSKCDRKVDYHLPKEKLHIRAGQRKLLICLMNGIQNALLYSNNAPKISLFLRKVNDCAEIEVFNSGTVLPDDFFENAGKSPSTKSFGRTGFGLAIIRNYVLSQDGKFSITPLRTGGASLKISFPLIEEYRIQSFMSASVRDYVTDEYSPIKLYLHEFLQTE